MEELRREQTERVDLLLQQQEEMVEKLVRENQVKVEEHLESLKRLRLESLEKEEELKARNERALATLIKENEAEEASTLAKHDLEMKAAERQKKLEKEGNTSSVYKPQIPECPVGVNFFGGQYNYRIGMPDICHFWYASALFRPVKSTPKSALICDQNCLVTK